MSEAKIKVLPKVGSYNEDMKEFFKISQKRREKIIEQIKQILQEKEEVLFAYVYGSFLDAPIFRDIDVGVYLKPKYFSQKKPSYKYTFSLADEIEEKIGRTPMVDVRILNEAPFYFLNNVFSRGEFLFTQDEELLVDLIENTSYRYLQYRPFAEQYLKERFGA